MTLGRICVAATLPVLIWALAGAAMPTYPPTAQSRASGVPFVREVDRGASLAGLSVFVAAGLEQQTVATSGIAALVAECLVRTPVEAAGGQREPLRDAIAALGGNVSYAVDDRTAHFYLESRPAELPALAALLAKAFAQPNFSGPILSAARATLTQRSNEGEKNPLRVGVQMFKESYLPAGSAFPDFGTSASLSQLGPQALADFFARTYRRGSVSASAVGAATPGLADALAALTQALPAGSVTAPDRPARVLPSNPKRVVVRRDVQGPFVVLGFAAPAPKDADFGAMLVLETLLSSAFERTSATTLNLAEKPVGALYLYETTPASLVVYVNGSSGLDPTGGLREIGLVAKSLATKRIAPDELRKLKAKTIGAFVTGVTTLADRSYLIGLFAADGIPNGSLDRALDAIDGTTAADIERAAKRYLQKYVVAIVLPRDNPTSH
jgi:predicted Zn-dependent peptidase